MGSGGPIWGSGGPIWGSDPEIRDLRVRSEGPKWWSKPLFRGFTPFGTILGPHLEHLLGPYLEHRTEGSLNGVLSTYKVSRESPTLFRGSQEGSPEGTCS